MSKKNPKYSLFAQRLEKAISDGRYPVGSYLPSQEKFMQREKLALSTVRQAIQELAARGLVEAQHGKGVRVLRLKPSSMPAGNHSVDKVGVVILGENDNDPVYLDVARGVSQAIAPLGGGILLFQSPQGYSKKEGLAEFVGQCNSIILVGAITHEDIETVKECNVPFVIAGHTISQEDEEDNNCITLDTQSAASIIIQNLAGFGHRRVVVCINDIVTGYQRGIISWFQRRAAEADMYCQVIISRQFEEGIAGYVSKCRANELPTSFVVERASVGQQLIAALAAKGLKVPEDVSVITIGTTEKLSEGSICLSRIGFDHEVLGSECMKILLKNTDTIFRQTLPAQFLPGVTVGPALARLAK